MNYQETKNLGYSYIARTYFIASVDVIYSRLHKTSSEASLSVMWGRWKCGSYWYFWTLFWARCRNVMWLGMCCVITCGEQASSCLLCNPHLCYVARWLYSRTSGCSPWLLE